MPWAEMRDIRNVVIHEYFGTSLPIVWKTITEDLPPKNQTAIPFEQSLTDPCWLADPPTCMPQTRGRLAANIEIAASASGLLAMTAFLLCHREGREAARGDLEGRPGRHIGRDPSREVLRGVLQDDRTRRGTCHCLVGLAHGGEAVSASLPGLVSTKESRAQN